MDSTQTKQRPTRTLNCFIAIDASKSNNIGLLGVETLHAQKTKHLTCNQSGLT